MDRVLIGELAHESNTFAAGRTRREHFRQRREYFDDAVIGKLRGTNSAIGGALEVAEAEGYALHPTVAASASPGGVVAADAYECYVDRIVDGAREHADALDGVFLALHGAMVPEGMDDGEGPLLAAVREAVGDVPVVATFDLHGNVTDRMVEAADALVACETYPHVDMDATGRRAMDLLGRIADGEVEPVTRVERPPLLPHGPLQNTRTGPMADVMARARDLEEREPILKANVFPGYHMADVPEMGFSVPVVADGDPAAAREAARELAALAWDRREAFVGDFPTPEEAVADATRAIGARGGGDGPVVLADVGDNPGGGAAGDGTALLEALLEADEPAVDAGVAILRDPEAVAACVAAGVRERVTVTLGGKTDEHHGGPVEDVDGYVAAVTDGRFRNTGPMGTGTRNDLGRAVRFECGTGDAVTVLLAENRLQPLDAEIWRHLGVQPERLDVLVVKSTNHFRADYEPMASRVIVVDSPGLSAIDVSRFDHERIPRPQFPLDDVPGDAYPDWE
jgi:microcystin degradation protein MlrC